MIKKKPTVLIPIETKVREFDGKLLLISYLLSKGYEVIFGNRKGVLKQLNYHRHSIYLAKGIYKQHSSFYEKMQKNNNKLCVLNVEGGVLAKEERSHFLSSYPDILMPYVTRIFLFGDKIKESFKKYVKNYSDNDLIVSGDPRFQLLKPEFREFYEQDINQIRKRYNNFILINTSFSIANPYVGEEKLFEFLNSNNDYDDKTVEGFKIKNSFYKFIIKYYIDAIKHLAKKYPETNFVIRPHPSESPDIYQESFNKYRNVYTTNEGNVHTWILAALGVIHYDCTTGIEALLAKKPTIAYVPEKDERVFAWLPAYLSRETDSLTFLDEYISNIIKGTFNQEMNKEKLQLLNSYFANNKLNSANVIANSIDQIFNENNIEQSFEERSFDYYKDKILNFVKQKKRELVSPAESSITQKKIGQITKNEIHSKLTILNKITGSEEKFRINKVEKNLFKIQGTTK